MSALRAGPRGKRPRATSFDPRISASRVAVCRACAEALEPRRLLALSISGASVVDEGSLYTLNLHDDNTAGNIVSWTIDWGEGDPQIVPGNPTSVTHTYPDGTVNRTISASATNDQSQTTTVPDSLGITVENVVPTIAVSGASTSDEGELYSLNLGAVIDPGVDTVTRFIIDWGDGGTTDITGNPANTVHTHIYADGPAARDITVALYDEDGSPHANAGTTLSVTVQDVAPKIAVSGAATVDEASLYTLNLGVVTDPGDDTITRYIINWDDGNFDDITGNPENTVHTHTYPDGPSTRNITISLFDEDGLPHAGAGVPNPFIVDVLNVAPTATLFNGGAVGEGSNGLVGFSGQSDPSNGDVVAGFRYSYDFNNDGDFGDAGELSDVTNAAVGVPAIYLTNGPGSRTVRGRIKDRDGGFTDYTTTITIFNVTPFVNAGPDVTIPATVAYTQVGNFNDPGADSPWTAMVDYDWHPGDNDAVPLTLSGFTYTLSNAYNTPGTYTTRVFVTDADGATGFDDVVVNVTAVPTLRVNQLLLNTSGFTLRFNRAIDLGVLNLYDGFDGSTPSNAPADLTLTGSFNGLIRGSLTWNPATNVLTFVRTGGPLLVDTYTLTVRSASDAFKDLAGGLLDGNSDGTTGDNYVNNFSVSSQTQRTLSVPDFARGPDALNSLNVPNTGTAGLPVRIDDGTQVRSIDFTLTWDPNLLTITGAQAAPGLPSDWSVTANLSTPGTAIVTMFGTSNDLPPGPSNLVKFIAHVPETSTYGASNLLRISNITVSRNDATSIGGRGDSGLHSVAYFGDTDGDRAYVGFDAALVARVVVSLDSGFHFFPVTDPLIVADTDGSGTLSGIDASFVAQKAAGLPRNEIPDLPPAPPPIHEGGSDRLISMPTNIPARPGGVVAAPLIIDDASNTLGFNVTLNYDTNLLDVADDTEGLSTAVAIGGVYAGAGNWQVVTNVDDATGKVTLVFWRSNGVPMPPGAGTIANVDFEVIPGATHGTVIPIDVGGTLNVGGLMFTHADGSILVDALAPTIEQSTFSYITAPHKLAFQFSEDVSASLHTNDFVVENLTTSATIPSNQFALSFNGNVATLAYLGNVLPDGDYRVTITAAGVTDPAGNPLASNHQFDFFFLMGDANHDRTVNLADFNILAANFGQSPRDFSQADFNYDGQVNLSDFNLLAGRFGTTLTSLHRLTPPTGAVPRLPGGVQGWPTQSAKKRSSPFSDVLLSDEQRSDRLV